jgi:hypothetical protein
VIDSKARELNDGYPRSTVSTMAEQARPRSGEHRTFRALFTIDGALWEDFGKLVSNRAEVLRQFIAWYVSKPGAKMPRRPKPRE